MKRTLIFLFACCIGFCGCASTDVYREVFNDDNGYNHKEFSEPKENLYNAVMKAFCSRNFIIEKEGDEKDFIFARRAFQKGKRTIILILQAKIISGTQNSTLYLNALQTTERSFVADRTRFFMFIVPLPGGGGKEATKIKEGEKIIEDKEFYRKFFAEIESIIQASEKTENTENAEAKEEKKKEDVSGEAESSTGAQEDRLKDTAAVEPAVSDTNEKK